MSSRALNMPDKYKIAIVGSGPGGLSAASHAAGKVSHSAGNLELPANTIEISEKQTRDGGAVVLPLRSPVPFVAGKGKRFCLHGRNPFNRSISTPGIRPR